MPYVPADSTQWREKRNAHTISSYKLSDGRWIQSRTVYDDYVVRRRASKFGSKGPKVKLSFGYWSPVKAYQRTATILRLVGGHELLVNAPPGLETVRNEGFGTPYFATADIGDVSINTGHTGGLLSSGVPVRSGNIENRLIAECRNKIADRKVNYGNSLGEGVKTFNHLAKTCSSILRALLALRRGNLSAFAKALGLSKRKSWYGLNPAALWLEVQYAWLPLMSDIYGSYQVVTDGLKNSNSVFSAVRQIQENGSYKCAMTAGTLKGSVTVSHRCKLWYTMHNQTVSYLAQLGLINPLEVAWEVVPFSFVVDWFIPVGTVLEAYSSTMGLSFVDGVITSIGRVNATGKHEIVPSSTPIRVGEGFSYVLDHYAMSRDKTSDIVGIYMKSPFSTSHVFSALALLTQLRRG